METADLRVPAHTQTRRSRGKNLIVALTLLVLVVLLWRTPLLVRTFHWGHRTFDSNVWRRSGPSNGWEERSEMTFNLLRTHELVGKSRSEVEDLLGKSDRSTSADGYIVGWVTGWVGVVVLTLEYDKDGRVSRVGIRED
jgi:hypothetical protein